jgi:cell division protein FtsZ
MQLEILDDFGAAVTVIKAIGPGGGGQNSIDCLIDKHVDGVQFIAVNTDMQALTRSKAGVKLPIGSKSTRGRGAGGKPEVGERAAEEDREMIVNALKGADMVFVTTGMGGGTGTGAAPVIAQIARELNILTVGIVTKPFVFEGKKKMEIAEAGIEKLRNSVDILIVIPNENLLKFADKKIGIQETFHLADDVLRQAIQGISDLITKPGEINIDFADVISIMKDQGDAVMGIGVGQGETRAHDAVVQAMNNQLIEETAIIDAKNILVGVCGGPDMSLVEYQEICNYARQKGDEDVNIISGYSLDTNMGDKIQVTIVATGFETATEKSKRLENEAARAKEKPREELFTSNEFDAILNNTRGFRSDDLEVPTFLRMKNAKDVKPEAVSPPRTSFGA